MFVNPRLFVVIAALFAFAFAKRLWAQRTIFLQRTRTVDRFPQAMLGGRPFTWVVFTTPLCVSCGPAVEQLRRKRPDAGMVVLDSTQHADLVERFKIRTAPTALLASSDGTVVARHAGAAAIRDFATL